MATSLAITTELKMAWQFSNAIDLTTVVDSQTYKNRETLTNGTADDKANDMWTDRLYLTAAAPEVVLELDGAASSGTVLSNVFGQTLTFTKIRQVVIVNKGIPDGTHATWTPTANCDVLVGGFGTNAWKSMFNNSTTAEILIPSGGMFVCTAPIDGWPVASNNSLLRIALEPGSSLFSVDVDVIIVGID